MKKLYIVDEDQDILESLRIWFTKQGLAVEVFTKPELLSVTLQHTTPNLILMDGNIRGDDGREICKQLKLSQKVTCPIILFSGDPVLLKEYKACLADDIVEKPFSLKEITGVVGAYLQFLDLAGHHFMRFRS